MPDKGLVHGIKAIDCLLSLDTEGGQAGGPVEEYGATLIRDPESRGYHHPAQHFFKDSPERIERGTSLEDTLVMMDEFGVEMAMIGVNPDQPDKALKVLEKYPKRFFGRLRVDPMEGMEGLRKVEAVAKGNPSIKALMFTPFRMQKPPNDKVCYPVYTKAIELDLPVTMTMGLPGPRVPGDCQNPLYLDEPLWFFPELKIVMMHGGEPWEAMCVKLMLKWPNLYYMTSAFAPRRYPKDIIYYANTRGSDKIMYAGYYPGLSYERLQNDLESLELRDHVWPKFLRENAARVFKLDVD